MKKILLSIRIYIIFTVLLGLIYPLVVTVIAQVILPYQANGSIMRNGDKVIGSKLIGQNFSNPEYFHSRPSANNYDAVNSGGTNLGPSSKKLMDSTAEKIAKVRQENGLSSDTKIPSDMVLSSASGLDPHISLQSALLQVNRISKIRGIAVKDLKKMIDNNTDTDFVGIWGRPGVNVFKLNLAIDDFAKDLK
ncbi:MAG: potassium-transporting ATPase subunit KdpC [Endomicrobiales bacterium]|nr:potassium-transporting ATPase subunit KdpC [Endomicrobiales bacterium]